jgi:poly(hydroxyalkanoate) granule-associated protein
METMSMEATGNVAAGIPEGQGMKAARAVGRSVRGVWWFGIGAVAVGGALAGQLIRTLVERGKQVEPRLAVPLKKVEGVGDVLSEAGTRLKGLGTSLGESAQKMEGAVEERFAGLLARTQAPLRQEVQELTKKVDELTRKLDQYEAKPGETQPPKDVVI